MNTPPPNSPPLRPGALLVGALGAGLIGAGVPYCKMVLHGSYIAAYFNTPAAIILFFFFILFGNTALGLLYRPLMLNRAELALVYIMWIVATAIPTWGFTSFLLPDITSLIYYATPENNWRELLLPYVPDWIIPHHDFQQIQHFYEGAPQGTGIPWGLWMRPLAFWIPFALALHTAMICIMIIVRRQWIERERLVYPLVQVPLAMIRDGDGLSLIKPFFRSPLMWTGFSLPAITQSLNGLNHYFPFIPGTSIASWSGFSIPLFRDTISLKISFSYQMLGFSYFINRDIAFGLWFFHLLNTAQQGIFNVLGFQEIDPILGAYSRYTGSIIVHQGFGALLVLVLFGLWTARGHLKEVFGKALGRRPDVDDSDEILSYRAAVSLLAASLLFMGVWLWKSGLPAWITPIYLLLALILFIGITRVVAEGGLAFIFAPMVASDFVAAGFGTRALGPTGIVALAFTYVWASDILTFVMASCANGLKLVEETIHKGRRLVFWAILLAIVVTLGASIWAIIDLAYRYGGINSDRFFFTWANSYPFNNAAERIAAPEGPHWANWGYTGIGAGVMGLLMLARQRFLWWPFHPLGFPISAAFGTMFFSVFLAWAIKSIVLKYGGPRLYLRTRPFFLGLILGQFGTAGLWYFIDFLTGSSGNVVMSW
ncbi:MAG: hypothetical protein GKR89_30190 [Candidatus Latescibacteria bacterium]|nr:hypothetical protein [Candidatus Latescibacterota bacterium]